MKKYFLALIVILIIPIYAGAAIQDIRVSNNTSAAVTISWITDDANAGEVHYSENPDLSNPLTAYDIRGQTFEGCTHYVDITNLKKKTTYYFEVVSGDDINNNNGDYYTFKTMEEPFAPPEICLQYGNVYQKDEITAAEGAIAYLWFTHNGVDSYLLSKLIDSKGSFLFNIKEARSVDTDNMFPSIDIDDPIHLKAVYCGNQTTDKDLVFEGCTHNCGSMTLGYSISTTTTTVPDNNTTTTTTTTIPDNNTSTTSTTTKPDSNTTTTVSSGGGDGSPGGDGGSTTSTTGPECLKNSDCDDGLFCNGVEICEDGTCHAGTSPCKADETCDEDNDVCVPPKPVPECDPPCDDGVFCNGVEKCVDGSCVSGDAPCDSGQTCMEDLKECWDVVTISASTPRLRTKLLRPFFRKKRCLWLRLQFEGDINFDSTRSKISCEGPGEDYHGVEINAQRSAWKLGRFVLIPLCIEKEATLGQWTVYIETEMGDADSPFKEQIEVSFEIK